MKCFIVNVIMLCIVMQVNCALVFENMRTVYSAKIFGFSWENCGKPDDPAVLKTLTLSPDPITVPGDLKASASGNTTVELAAPLAVNVTLEKEMAGFWINVPCVEKMGSCHYADVCDLLNQLIPPGQDCPEPLHTYGIPCHCPFKAMAGPHTLQMAGPPSLQMAGLVLYPADGWSGPPTLLMAGLVLLPC
ncbi:ganglioside GM2 activator-like isoform X2 [Salvelinus fontinalis]|uniref:ganglioside GM2 activator-like isoform X2 n=1 Tax=Salvelinus fontinalis TaxID=8038 RepID=UPI0024850E6E|nr:ganglioside GM2 activator-like isoform X2 [Salvelinus fontinalis]